MQRRDFLAAGSASIAALSSPLVRPGRLDAGPPGAWAVPRAFRDGLPALLGEAFVPGVAIAVVEDGVVTERFGAGTRDARSGAAMTAQTPTAAASLGKPVFALAALRLVQAGVLDLDRPLAALAEVPDLAGADAAVRALTARHVLSHTTGLPNWRRRVEPLAVTGTPGERFRYSGEGFVLLAGVLEQLTGKPAEQIVREQVFEPVGMAHSSFARPAALMREVATGHGSDGSANPFMAEQAERLAGAEARLGAPMERWTTTDAVRAVGLAWPDVPAVPNMALPNVAGSLLTTADDYARFLAALFGPRAATLLDDALHREMLRPHAALGGRLHWGLGWALQREATGASPELLAWHWGDNGTYKNFVMADPRHGRAVVAFTNGSSGFKVYERAIRAVTGRDQAALLFWMVG